MLRNKKIIIGVTGSVAAYKACYLVNVLIKNGCDVKVVMTDSAAKFIGAATFQALTNHPVYTDLWNPFNLDSIEHITLAQWADAIVIAPVTSHTISKIACGLCDNFLTAVVAASLPKTPVIIAPAMNVNMWNNEFFQANYQKLKKNKRFFLINPRDGILACRETGKGKIASTESIVECLKKIFTKK